MDIYNFYPSLNPMNDKNVAKKRNSRFHMDLDADFCGEFMKELALMKIKLPFLTESQLRGRTFDKFCIPNLMGKPYKKSKSGTITMCSLRLARPIFTKAYSERKFNSRMPQSEGQRRHTIATKYFPIEVITSKIKKRINSKVSKKLFQDYTLFSDGMEDDSYSIQTATTEDSELENFNPDTHSPSYKMNFMNKSFEGIKPRVKTYENYSSKKSDNSVKRNQRYHTNLKQSNNKGNSKNLELLVVSEEKEDTNKSQSDKSEIERNENLNNVRATSDYEGCIIENSIEEEDKTHQIVKRPEMLKKNPQQNFSATPFSLDTNKSLKYNSPVKRMARDKMDLSCQQMKGKVSSNSSCKQIKQSISQVSLEYLDSPGFSSSTFDRKNLDLGNLYGVKCLSTTKMHMPLATVCSSEKKQSNEHESPKIKNPTSPVGSKQALRRCSISVPYIDEGSQNSSWETDSNESPLREMEEADDEPYCTPTRNGKQKSSCGSSEYNYTRHHGKFSPCFVQFHSSPRTESQISVENDNIEVANSLGQTTDDGPSEYRGNFSPQYANVSQTLVQGTTLSQTTSMENDESDSDGYFLANLFDDFTSHSRWRTLRSSVEKCSPVAGDDDILTME